MKLNRIRVVLAEKDKTNKWLSDKVGKSQVTVSRWCSNDHQPSLQDLQIIAEALDVDIKDLINSTKKDV